MKKRAKPTPQEAQFLKELLVSQTTRIGIRKSEQKGWSDLPLFEVKPPSLFD